MLICWRALRRYQRAAHNAFIMTLRRFSLLIARYTDIDAIFGHYLLGLRFDNAGASQRHLLPPFAAWHKKRQRPPLICYQPTVMRGRIIHAQHGHNFPAAYAIIMMLDAFASSPR